MEFYSWEFDKKGSVPDEPGFYILYLNASINNLLRVDPNGIMYIGESEDLQERLKIVKRPKWKEWYEKEKEEMFDHNLLTYAVDFDDDYKLIPHPEWSDHEVFKNKNLQLKYCIEENHEEEERKLLQGHIILYGQLPPWNFTGSSLKDVWEKIENDTEWEELVAHYKKKINLL